MPIGPQTPSSCQGQTLAAGTFSYSFSQQYLSYMLGAVQGAGDTEETGQLGFC